MKFFNKKSENTFLLRINVKPNSHKQKIIKPLNDDKYITILLRSKAVKNRANKELINLLKKKYSLETNQIRIISGITSKNKLIQIEFNNNFEEKEFLDYLFE
jgi:uncharacterized protein (TIGR00251 family)